MNWLVFINSIIIAGALESRVYYGTEIHPEEHGHLVKLSMDGGMCSGSIISENWIVTSAHCFEEPTAWVTVRQITRAGNERTLATASGNNIRKHPDYVDYDRSARNSQNDIALLKTNKPIQFIEYIRPIKLARFQPKVGASAVIAGYGTNEFNDDKPREALLQIVQCTYDSYFNVGTLLCTHKKAGSWPGDSGGPLVSKGRLVGVTHGSTCNETYHSEDCLSVYASVAAHLDWIKRETS